MIKNLFIIRHGHADFTANKDFERVLTLTGIKAVNKTAEFINAMCQKKNLGVGLCISSSANRTMQTAEIIGFKCDIKFTENYKELYSCVPSLWIDKIAESSHQNIAIVGHNPTLSQLINNLCGKNIYMEPASCAFVSLEIKQDGIIYPAQLIEYFQYE